MDTNPSCEEKNEASQLLDQLAMGSPRSDERRLTEYDIEKGGGYYPKGMMVDELDTKQFQEKKLFTELLCNRGNIKDYVEITDMEPIKGSGKIRNYFSSLYVNLLVHFTGRKRKLRRVEKSIAFDQWHACARWVKFLEILEGEGKRWSRPHVTTLCPYYIQLLRDNLIIVPSEDLSEYKRTNRPKADDEEEIYQAIYLCDDGEENEQILIKLDPGELKWVISNGKPHDRYEIGRAIGGIFSCEEYKLTIGDSNISTVKAVIDSFLHHSTLVPFNSWDPRFRMIPPKIEDNVPKWLDPEMRKEGGKDHHEVGGGLKSDIKFKLKYFKSDWLDGFQFQCLSSIIFCYFVNITPIITFGAMTQDDTHGWIGAIESIIGASVCGIIWAFTAGQPLIIISQTGPMLVFDRIMYQLVDNWINKDKEEVSYLLFRVYVGLWTCLFCLLIVVTKGSKLVKFITNFTEECFACLISLIFIIDGIKKIVGSVNIKQWPGCEGLPRITEEMMNGTISATNECIDINEFQYSSCHDFMSAVKTQSLCRQNNTDEYVFNPNSPACLSYETCKAEAGYFGMLLSCLTLFLCFLFKSFRSSSLFTTTIRNQLANFGVVISIGLCVLLDNKAKIPTWKLDVPNSFTTTLNRSWLVDFSVNPKWLGVAILPALLCTVLVFLDQQITAVIINRRENKLKKGEGYHLDLMIIAILIPVCTFFGLPLYSGRLIHFCPSQSFDSKPLKITSDLPSPM